MGISVETLAVAKKYTNRSIEGITGSLAGKNATIESITDIAGGHRVTFKWTADNGDVRTQTMDVMDGSKGDKGETGDAGLGIKAVNINAQSHLIITYDDDSTYDAGELPGGSGEVISVNGKKGVVTLDANDVGALPDDTELFSGDYNDLDNLPDLTNFITNTVDNLVNYYKKTETYTKTEVDNIANAIKNGRFEVVATLPTTDIKTNVIYLVPKSTAQASNIKDEYINLDGTSAGWEKIGDTEIDLSGYVTTTALNTALAAYTTTTDLTALLADKVDKVIGKGLSTNDYANTDKELVDSIPTLAPISLVKDTVGWIGKNLLKNTGKNTTSAGITTTINADKSITLNGTATSGDNQCFLYGTGWGQNNYVPINETPFEVGKTYIMSKGSPDETARLIFYFYNDDTYITDAKCIQKDVTFTIPQNTTHLACVVRVNNGATVSNLTFYPMIRHADILDDTYEPYHESVETMYEEEIHGINLLKYNAEIVPGYTKTSYGITCVVNDDYSVTANGTREAGSGGGGLGISTTYEYPPGDYIVSGCPQGGSRSTYMLYVGDSSWTLLAADTGSGAHIHLSTKQIVKIEVHITSGTTVNNLVFKPMLRKADIEDSTYRPYNPQAIQNQLNAQGVLGAKNLLPIILSTQTENGVTVTVNKDSSDNVLSVVLNGTATSSGQFNLNNTSGLLNSLLQKYGDLIWSGCPSRNDCRMYTHIQNGSYVTLTNGEEKILSASNNYDANILVQYDNGVTYNNVAFYPMLRLASDPDDTYQPYAMTNRELTENTRGLKVYTAGDTVQCGRSLVGHITTGTTKLELTLRGNFDKANISNVSVGTTPLLIRGINGYLKTNNDVELNNILFSNYLKLDNAYIYPQYIDLVISLIDDGVFTNVTNNTLIDIQGMTLILS